MGLFNKSCCLCGAVYNKRFMTVAKVYNLVIDCTEKLWYCKKCKPEPDYKLCSKCWGKGKIEVR